MGFREVIKLAAASVVMACIAFFSAELVLRIYMFGAAGLSPAKVESYVSIMDTDMVQPADNLEVWYELKPDQDSLLRAVPFKTNSQGLADKEYSLDKPANTYRVAVLGSSWEMGSGVPMEAAYHSVLEDEFNQQSKSMHYEFINFGVESYGLQEIMGTLRHKVLRYHPDMILVSMTGYTQAKPWLPHDVPFVAQSERHSGWTSYAAIRLRGMLGIKKETPAPLNRIPPAMPPTDFSSVLQQMIRAVAELGEFSAINNIPVAEVWVRFSLDQKDRDAGVFSVDQAFSGVAKEHNISGVVVNLDEYLQPGEPIHKLMVNRFDNHPSVQTHKIIAAELRKKLFDSNPDFPAP